MAINACKGPSDMRTEASVLSFGHRIVRTICRPELLFYHRSVQVYNRWFVGGSFYRAVGHQCRLRLSNYGCNSWQSAR